MAPHPPGLGWTPDDVGLGGLRPAGWKVTPLKVWRRRGPTEDLRPPCQTASWSKWPRPACHQLTMRLPVSLAPSVPSPALSALRVVL